MPRGSTPSWHCRDRTWEWNLSFLLQTKKDIREIRRSCGATFIPLMVNKLSCSYLTCPEIIRFISSSFHTRLYSGITSSVLYHHPFLLLRHLCILILLVTFVPVCGGRVYPALRAPSPRCRLPRTPGCETSQTSGRDADWRGQSGKKVNAATLVVPPQQQMKRRRCGVRTPALGLRSSGRTLGLG